MFLEVFSAQKHRSRAEKLTFEINLTDSGGAWAREGGGRNRGRRVEARTRSVELQISVTCKNNHNEAFGVLQSQ
jgi:hypothetical protein